jgi:hypothetical protein
VPAYLDDALRPGLAFMTFHFPEQVQTNQLTIDTTDPKVRHGRVQGHGHPYREARRRRPRALNRSC